MCSPLPLASLILHKDGNAEIFIDPDKVTSEVRAHFGNQVSISPEDKLSLRLNDLKGKTVMVDPSTSSSLMFDTLEKAGAHIMRAMDPISLPKARKNNAEISGATQAHNSRRRSSDQFFYIGWTPKPKMA